MPRGPREPLFNAPAVVVALIGACVVIHGVRLVLTPEQDVEALLRFAFIPARYDPASPFAGEFAALEPGPAVWTFLTHAFLHGDLAHLAVNVVGMLAFGSAVAWRFGAVRFLVFSAACAVAGAATHLALHFGEPAPVIGASAAISGQMAAAARFMFEAGGPLSAFRRQDRGAFSVPAAPLRIALRNRQVLIFLAVWFAANLLFGLGGAAVVGSEGAVAWEAHVGGFLAGLALFPLLDPKVAPSDGSREPDAGLRPPARGPHDDGFGDAGRP